MKVLIVDDEPDILTMVSRFLTNEGMQVDCAEMITEARTEVMQNTYEAAILDLNLPDGTGFDLISSIRRQNEDCKIIVISAYDNYDDLEPEGGAKVDLFLKKPFSKKQLIHAILQGNE